MAFYADLLIPDQWIMKVPTINVMYIFYRPCRMEKMALLSTRKRPFVELTGEAGQKVFKFKILLPNGCTTCIILQEPRNEMNLRDFVNLIRQEYERGGNKLSSGNRQINWDGDIYLEDMSETEIRRKIHFNCFEPHKLYLLRLHDGYEEMVHTFKNMWDLTPDKDLLSELPAQYTFETALADLIDNSLQAAWRNNIGQRRLVSVMVDKVALTIIDTGPGMDGSEENSIVKWGKMGSSSHRASRVLAVGGKPPYLKPFFGMFGYGGPVASMHLGRRTVVSSKTVTSKKVYTLFFERDALLKKGGPDLFWRTDGGIRKPLAEEMEVSPHGSFTKVQIYDLKHKCLNISQLQCRLKDIYFPYIQCDEMHGTGKTATPIQFQVNDVNLAEIEGGETAITNLHSCNGSNFVFEVHFSIKQEMDSNETRGLPRRANARLKCVYFPIIEGKENIDRILEKLKADGWETAENFENFARVSIRRLGRLLPDARWGMLPFMESKLRKGDKAQILKRCCLRVKCFIDTDAGFSPTPSKTDLALHDSFTSALKSFGNKHTASDVSTNVHKDGRPLSLSQLEKEYKDWVQNMHDQYDEEIDSGEDQPIHVLNPTKRKKLGISSNVVRVHKVIARKGKLWESGQKVKIFKGAVGNYKNNLYATLEYILLEGFQGDVGREARLICRPLGCPEDKGCLLKVDGDIACLDIHDSLSFPISVIDSGKCEAIDSVTWNSQLDKHLQKLPSAINVLNSEQCCQLQIDGALPVTKVNAGHIPPEKVAAVIRPANFISHSPALDQKDILKDDLEMMMEINYVDGAKDSQGGECITSLRVKPSTHSGFHGLYLFSLKGIHPQLFNKSGVYNFSFSIISTSCQKCEIQVVVVPSKAKIWELKWPALADGSLLSFKNGVHAPPLSVICFDAYHNQLPFKSEPEVIVLLKAKDITLSRVNKLKLSFSSFKMSLEIRDLLVESSNLDLIRPLYKATVEICSRDKLFCATAPCQIYPGMIHSIELKEASEMENDFVPGDVIKHLCLEVFDAYGNHVNGGTEVRVEVDGLQFQECTGSDQKVDDHGLVNLGGRLKVVGGYGTTVFLYAYAGSRRLIEKEFQVTKRELRVVSRIPCYCAAGSQLENVIFEVVDSNGVVDKAIHGQQHTLVITSDTTYLNNTIQYTFLCGRCMVPSFQIPVVEGKFSLRPCHSRHPELYTNIEIMIIRTPKLELVENDSNIAQSPCSNGWSLPVPGPSPVSPTQTSSLFSFIRQESMKLQNALEEVAQQVGMQQSRRSSLINLTENIEKELHELQVDPESMINFDHLMYAKDQIVHRIKGQGDTAAAFFCDFSKAIQFREAEHFMRDVVGLVALLGSVKSEHLSRILAEYVGENYMLGVVCKSYESAVAIEKYRESGKLDRQSGLYELASQLRREIKGRFLVLCLEDIRPFEGRLKGKDPQRTLALSDPILQSRKKPRGFLGYAVNMVDLDLHDLAVRTSKGYGLRETLFYRLFKDLQVYRTREDMRRARYCIQSAAVSLDGGIMHENGVICLGDSKPEVMFPVVKQDVHKSLIQRPVDIDGIESKLSQLNVVRAEIAKIEEGLDAAKTKYWKRTEKLQKLQRFLNEKNNTSRYALPALDCEANMKTE